MVTKISKICLFVLTWSTNVTDTQTDTAWRHRLISRLIRVQTTPRFTVTVSRLTGSLTQQVPACTDRCFGVDEGKPAAAKGKGLDTCYSATYMSQTRDQQRFTISEVAKTEVLWCASSRQHQIPTGPVRVGDALVSPATSPGSWCLHRRRGVYEIENTSHCQSMFCSTAPDP